MQEQILKFYKETKDRYIKQAEIVKLKEKYQELYLYSKKKKRNKTFQKDYLSLEKRIRSSNEQFLDSKRKEVPLLDNINGYPLDTYQSRVVLSEENNILVIAGAGAGKSLTIIGKIIYLIKECLLSPQEILCISFTNDATNNLKKNIMKNYNIEIDIFTFHKLALNIVNEQHQTYDIAPPDLLDTCIDQFFSLYASKYKKEIQIVLEEVKDKTNSKNMIKTFISLFKTNNYPIEYFKTILKRIKKITNWKSIKKEKALFLLIVNIYLFYEQTLKENNFLDFNDMINQAIENMEKYGLQKKWKYVIIDEYQDTSKIKFLMIKKILELTQAKLLVVGDDFQSIYRFTGCDLQMFLQFKKYFTDAVIYPIVNTYRNPQELINVAGHFIMKNKQQQQKKLHAEKRLQKPIKIVYHANKIKNLKQVLEIQEDNKEILVLGRNNKDIYSYIDEEFTQEENKYTYKDKKFTYLTMHRSKGLESDIVILINVENHSTGMPTKLVEERMIRYLTNTKEYYPYEEERRLFYVALTRTKSYTYILSTYQKESIFVKELKKYREVEIIKELPTRR